MPKVKSVFVIDYYEGIQGKLDLREDFPYKGFLSNPRLRTQTEIIWSTEAFSDKPSLLKDLQGTLKERYGFALKERIDALEALIDSMRAEGDEELAHLLSKTVSYVDERSVYCGDGNVVVVNWGLIPRQTELTGSSIYRSGKFVGIWATLPNLAAMKTDFADWKPSVELPVDSTNVPVRETTLNEAAKPITREEVIDIPIDEIPVEQIDTHTKVTRKQEDKVTSPNNLITSSPDLQKGEKSNEVSAFDSLQEGNQQPYTERKEPLRKVVDKEEKEELKKHDNYTWKTLFKGFFGGLSFVAKKLWWLLLLVLLVVLAMYLGRTYQGEINQFNPFFEPLPEDPALLPVEEGAVGMSEDGMGRIATDRLNILLESSAPDAMLEWAKAFKKEYSSTDYWVFYYNKELNMLQIKVPSDKREQVKNEIQDKLSQFVFEVFDETVYQSEALSFNDPEVKNPVHSWYLNAIKAFDAWNFTLGDPNVVVAVVDNGFDLKHPEFADKIVRPYNALTRNSAVRPIFSKGGEDAHGTHVAATAVGRCNNRTGLMGVAPNCKLMPIQVGYDNPQGDLVSQAIVDGTLYAINQGADVINLSVGMSAPPAVKGMSEGQQLNYISSSYKQEEMLWNKVYEKAKQKNCIIVFSAGNENVIAGIDPKKRNKYAVIVSAVNTSLGKANFSNYGRYEKLNRVYSTVSAPGVSIYNALPNGKYGSLQGTSMAAPIVTGAIALLKSVNKNMTASQAADILKRTGREVNPSIGPLINLQRAMFEAFNGTKPTNCEAIAKEIERLRARIDSLKQLCPDAGAPADTLKYEDAVKGNLDGLWKTTTSLVASMDQSPIELYMQFRNLKGTLTVKNKGHNFTAPLTAVINNGRISITQHSDATCPGVDYRFLKYSYACKADAKKNLMCTGTNSTGTVRFNLIRVK